MKIESDAATSGNGSNAVRPAGKPAPLGKRAAQLASKRRNERRGPTRTDVLDGSAVVALLVDAGAVGEWVEDTVAGAGLFAPELLPYEAGNILRRHTQAGIIDATAATLAHTDLMALPIDLYPYATVAERVWELRDNITAYDASYVALAELLAASLVTLDERLARAPGTHCPILTYQAAT